MLNPYYRHMGGLYGSEYWTYLLPRRVGPDDGRAADRGAVQPVGARRAVEIGLLDAAFGATAASLPGAGARLRRAPGARPATLASGSSEKRRAARRATSSASRSRAYRAEELARSHRCFFGPDRSYHEARRRFVYKLGAAAGDLQVASPAQAVPLPVAVGG